MNNCFNYLSCGFLKANSTQHALPRLIQSLKKNLDSSGLVWTILMDLSNANDCLPHDLLIAKLQAYGLDQPSLGLVNVYLRFHRIVTGLMLPGMFLGYPFWGLYFLIFLSMIFFLIYQKIWYMQTCWRSYIVLFWKKSLSNFEKTWKWHKNPF